MKHASTRAVFARWTERRGSRPAPERGDIDPVTIRHALGDTFMLAADFVDELRFRLAGTRVCALFRRELKGESFGALWSERSRKAAEELLTIVSNESAGAVAGVTAHAADGDIVEMELLLLPLAYAGHARIRALGVLVPAVPPYWVGEKPVADLEIGTLRHINGDAETETAPRFIRPPLGGRMRHGFVVYSGGRETPSGDQTG